MKRVLVLGAGLVTRPLVRYFLEKCDFRVEVATRTISKAEKLINNHPHGKTSQLDLTRPSSLEKFIPNADLVISLVPYAFHSTVAEFCIKHRKPMITTSYVSDAMRALDKHAKEAGIPILNEVGLDPGIDHMSAMQIIHQVEDAGGRITGFSSYCGGLPAPEANTNPLGYKFSWSPKGVLLAGRNSAKFLRNGKEVNIPAEELFENYWPVEVEGLGEFEAYPNRDSLSYVGTYGLRGVRGMLRGTLRYKGWCLFMKKIVELGFLNDEKKEGLRGLTCGDLIRRLTGTGKGEALRKPLARFLKVPEDSEVIDKLEWLGFLGDDPLPQGDTPLDLMVAVMLSKLQYKEGERDMIVLQHEFHVEYPSSGKKERIISALVDFGIPRGDSSMSRTVSLPAAIAGRMILEGKIRSKGVCIPVTPEIYEPVLGELEEQNISFRERRESL